MTKLIEAVKAFLESEDEVMENNVMQQLISKAETEMDEYKKELLTQEPSVILDRSYETAVKEELLSIIQTGYMSETDANRILSNKYPIDALYEEWLHNDYSYDEVYVQTIEDLSEAIKESERHEKA